MSNIDAARRARSERLQAAIVVAKTTRKSLASSLGVKVGAVAGWVTRGDPDEGGPQSRGALTRHGRKAHPVTSATIAAALGCPASMLDLGCEWWPAWRPPALTGKTNTEEAVRAVAVLAAHALADVPPATRRAVLGGDAEGLGPLLEAVALASLAGSAILDRPFSDVIDEVDGPG